MISGLVVYWGIGAVLFALGFDQRLVNKARGYMEDNDLELNRQQFLCVLFVALCLAAFVWPLALLPKKK